MKTVFTTGGELSGTGAPVENATPANLASLQNINGIAIAASPDANMYSGADADSFKLRDRAASGKLFYNPVDTQTQPPGVAANGFGGSYTGNTLRFSYGDSRAKTLTASGTILSARPVIPTGDFSMFVPVMFQAAGNGDFLGGANRGSVTPYWWWYMNGNGFLKIHNDGNDAALYSGSTDLRGGAPVLIEIHHSPDTSTEDNASTNIYLDGASVATATGASDFRGDANRRLAIGSSVTAAGAIGTPAICDIGTIFIVSGRTLDSGNAADTADLNLIMTYYENEYGLTLPTRS